MMTTAMAITQADATQANRATSEPIIDDDLPPGPSGVIPSLCDPSVEKKMCLLYRLTHRTLKFN